FAVMLKPITAAVASAGTSSFSTLRACTANTYRCGQPGGGAAPPYSLAPKSLRPCLAPAGRPLNSGPVPAPVGSSVTVAGMSYSSQCQNPLPVGASGSKQVTAKLFVPSGAPDQRRCGERFCPDIPQPLKTWASASRSPSRTSALSTVSDGTAGR